MKNEKTNELSKDDVGVGWDNAWETAKAVMERCGEMMVDDAVAKKLTPADLNNIAQAMKTSWSFMDTLMEDPDDGK